MRIFMHPATVAAEQLIKGRVEMADLNQSFWSIPSEDILKNFKAPKDGLTNEEAKKRFITYGPNSIRPQKSDSALLLFLSQFKSPITVILLIPNPLHLFFRK